MSEIKKKYSLKMIKGLQKTANHCENNSTNETLLDKAISNYNVALMIYNSAGGDGSYLDFIGFHLQQSVEMVIKYVLDANGVSDPRIHDIDQLLRIANENGIDTLTTGYIQDHSEMFSLWESHTRHVLDSQLEMPKVEKAIGEVDVYLDKLSESEIQQNNRIPMPDRDVSL